MTASKMANKKDLRIKKLFERGITDYRVIAHKLGYNGGQTDAGIERVKEGLARMGINETRNGSTVQTSGAR